MSKPRIRIKASEPSAVGGAFEGASRTSQELAMWQPSMRSADADNNPDKPLLDARARDLDRNDGMVHGAIQIHKDGIVGHTFRLNAKPNWEVLGLSEEWAREFQAAAEAKFRLYAEGNANYVDASRTNTFTELVRLATGIYTVQGEVLATVEWLRDRARPFSTAVQMIDSDRLSNPLGVSDSSKLRAGVERDFRGAPVAYHIRRGHPGAFDDLNTYRWNRVPVRKPWGRLQVIHIVEQHRVDQSRGVSDMVSVLKEMKMTKKYGDVVLQNAVVNATFAAAIESDLPPEAAFETLGMGGAQDWAADFLESVAEYTGSSRNIHIDGAKIPHLYPGTKLKLLNAGNPGGVGTSFEESLHRNIAAGFGLSYEQFTRDYTKTNYSSSRASMGETWKFLQSRKKIVADRFATEIYALWVEEAINKGELPVPPNAPNFYEGLNREAYTQCTWIGASRGQVDEWKETQAAALRIKSGLSTYEVECARLGSDFRDVFTQASREQSMMEQMGLSFGEEPKAEAPAPESKPAPAKEDENPEDEDTDESE